MLQADKTSLNDIIARKEKNWNITNDSVIMSVNANSYISLPCICASLAANIKKLKSSIQACFVLEGVLSD